MEWSEIDEQIIGNWEDEEVLVRTATGKHVSDVYGYEGHHRSSHGALLSPAKIVAPNHPTTRLTSDNHHYHD